MDNLLGNEMFCTGMAVGIQLHQDRVVAAHERKEPIRIGEEIFYIQSGRERLEEVLDRICK